MKVIIDIIEDDVSRYLTEFSKDIYEIVLTAEQVN